MGPARTILFLCPHNAAKSVVAAAYFDQLARDRGLAYRAASAGTESGCRAVAGGCRLAAGRGHHVAGHRPRRRTTRI